MKAALIEIFERDINKLITEVSAYTGDRKLWLVDKGISNSAGNLCLHLVGNLNHFIGTVLGGSGYVRKRDEEFSTKEVSRVQLISMLEQAREVVVNTLRSMTPAALAADFPEEKHGGVQKTDYMLIHLLAHLNYHLGQVNYHRRLLDN